MAQRIIGITGGIGAGKSVISRILRGRGFIVFDCDREARRLMTADDELKRRLVNLCGENVYKENGELDRPYLASIIFNDDEKRKEVNGCVHAAVRHEFISISEKIKDIVFVEAAIMGSSGLARLCGEIWNVIAPEEIRVARALSRGNITEENIRARIEAQKHESDLLRRSGTVIKTIENSPSSALMEKIDELLNGCEV